MKSDGESIAPGRLVRGYALLGVLSEFHRHPAHKAFKGRALLYAQRLSRRPDRPGVSGTGLSPWRCGPTSRRTGRPRSSKTENGKQRLVLDSRLGRRHRRLFPVSSAANADTGPSEEARRIIAYAHSCISAYDVCRASRSERRCGHGTILFPRRRWMFEFFGVSIQHVTTVIGPQGLDHFISKRIPATEDLPANVKVHPSDTRTSVQVAALLDRAGRRRAMLASQPGVLSGT